jgi:putative flavoprotein involved in K+ transport
MRQEEIMLHARTPHAQGPVIDTLDVLVIGGGQAGLAIGYHLAQRGARFLIVDAGATVGATWRGRWDSLRLFTPAQYDSLPGLPFPAPADTYPGKDDVAAYLESYVETFNLPVRLATPVTKLERRDGIYLATTGDEVIRARQVVLATGPFQTPFVPAVADGLDPQVVQLHSTAYRNPDALPTGRVLVVGGGNTGAQIAQELAKTRQVELAIGRKLPTFPQRFLGRDLWWWLTLLGIDRVTVDSRLGQRISQRDQLIGTRLRDLVRRDGVALRPRVTGTSGRTVTFADGGAAEVDAVVWATGFTTDHSWIDVPAAKDEQGRIIHERGVSPSPGLYLLGMSWQHTRTSALLGWVGEDAAYLAGRIGDAADTTTAPAAPTPTVTAA